LTIVHTAGVWRPVREARFPTDFRHRVRRVEPFVPGFTNPSAAPYRVRATRAPRPRRSACARSPASPRTSRSTTARRRVGLVGQSAPCTTRGTVSEGFGRGARGARDQAADNGLSTRVRVARVQSHTSNGLLILNKTVELNKYIYQFSMSSMSSDTKGTPKWYHFVSGCTRTGTRGRGRWLPMDPLEHATTGAPAERVRADRGVVSPVLEHSLVFLMLAHAGEE